MHTSRALAKSNPPRVTISRMEPTALQTVAAKDTVNSHHENGAGGELDLFDGVPVDLGDGKKHYLRYTLKSFKRLKGLMGRSMLGLRGELMNLDEDMLPVLIREGLRGEDGRETEVTIEQLENLPVRYFKPLLDAFLEAFQGSRPKDKPATETATIPPAA